MRSVVFILLSAALVSACSETNLDDLDQAELKGIEEQVEVEAKSLEEAADEAIMVLEEEIQLALDEDGFQTQQENRTEPNDLQDGQE